jgi:hypothetical protein
VRRQDKLSHALQPRHALRLNPALKQNNPAQPLRLPMT